jgi:hypothetical protein
MLRQPARPNPSRRQVGSGASIPPPVGGWDAVSPLAAMPEDRAPVLDNWIPRLGYIEVRKGYKAHAGNMGSGVVDSLMVYNGLTSALSAMFAVTGGSIYDVSSSGAAVISTVTGLGNNRWQYVNFTTSGGKFLWLCNGTDAPRHYNGTTWATPSLSITTYASTDIINVNGHKNRLWFVFKNSTVAGYLPTGAVAGTITNFELGGLLTKGGFLVAMGTWTRDGGAGEDDLAVFVSSRGQAAIYQGTDPSSASTWGLIGVFDLGAPIGYRCLTKVAGDLALINIDGVLPLSKALASDRGAAAAIAITANINNAMNAAAQSYKDNFGWELTPYATATLALLNVPLQTGATQHQYVMNTLSGAWCRFIGWNANTFAVFRDALYFGGNDGVVYQADTSSLDLDSEVDAVGQTAYNYFKSRGVLKDFKLIQPLITTDSDSVPAIGLSTDFKDNAVLATPSTSAIEAALFDEAIWDVDVFPVESRNIADWSGIPGHGHCASVHFRARTGNPSVISLWGSAVWGLDPWSQTVPGNIVVRLNGFNVIYERGGSM